MDKKGTIAMALLVVFAVIGFVAISLTRSDLDTASPKGGTASSSDWMNEPAEEKPELTVTQKTVVTAKHAYQNGEHIIAGEIPLPTPCHILESAGSVSADKKQVFVALMSSIKTGETCAEVITPARFKLNVKADQRAKITATLNGQEVTLNLIEAGPNENLDNFELYIKG